MIITQVGKLGNLFEIRRDVPKEGDNNSSVYNIR